MWHSFRVLTTVLLMGLATVSAAEPVPSGKRVYVLPISGPIDKGMLIVFRRAFREAERTRPDAIVIELDTPGGGLAETREIIAWIRAQRKNSPVYAFVNPDALSAGAIISLGTDAIFMSSSATIGSAMPILINPMGSGVVELPADVKEKILSSVRAMVRSLAQENGYNEDLAEAMVDPTKEFKVGDVVVSEAGKLLNLTAQEAVRVIEPETKPLLARAIVEDLPGLLKEAGLEGAVVTRFEEESADRLARWITLLGPLLLAAGLLGVYIEFRTPGIGLPGVLGAVCLGVYFFGHYVAGLAGWEDLALMVIGLVLLAVEIFVLPGFGIAGIAGIGCLGLGAFMALIPRLPKLVPIEGMNEPSLTSHFTEIALRNLTITMLLVVLFAWLLSKYLPKTSFYHALVLETGLSNADGYVASNSAKYSQFLGQEGVARTMLRPAGTAEFGSERLDVVSTGDLVPQGTRIRVVRVEGGRIVVERVEDGPKEV